MLGENKAPIIVDLCRRARIMRNSSSLSNEASEVSLTMKVISPKKNEKKYDGVDALFDHQLKIRCLCV